jgi:hypothetical protein
MHPVITNKMSVNEHRFSPVSGNNNTQHSPLCSLRRTVSLNWNHPAAGIHEFRTTAKPNAGTRPFCIYLAIHRQNETLILGGIQEMNSRGK